jgi:hypothetical protein
VYKVSYVTLFGFLASSIANVDFNTHFLTSKRAVTAAIIDQGDCNIDLRIQGEEPEKELVRNILVFAQEENQQFSISFIFSCF